MGSSAQAQTFPSTGADYPSNTEPQGKEFFRVGIGEKKNLSIEGEFPFVEDEELLQIVGQRSGEVILLGLRAGTTQLFFLKEGRILFRSIEVVPPLGLSQSSLGPNFIHNKPYFVYEFQNDSAFSDQSFYDRPLFSYRLFSDIPVSGGGHITSNLQFQHLGDNHGDLRNGNIYYQDDRYRFSFGDSVVSFQKIFGELLSGATIVGSNLQFRHPNVLGGFQQEINLFGGVKKTADLLDLEDRNQLYGGSYYIYRPVAGAIQPDIFNFSFFTYQDPSSQVFRLGAVAEENYHLTQDFSLGAGFTRLQGGFATGIAPVYQTKETLVQSRYSYFNHGLQALTGPPLQNDLHTMQINFQQYIKNRAYLVGGGLFGNVSLQKGDSLIPGNNNQSAQLYFRKNSSFRRDYTIAYGLTRSSIADNTVLSNLISGSMSYPATNTLYITHGLSFARNDLDREDNIINASTGFHFESSKLRFDFDVTTGATINSDDYKHSLVFNESFQFNVPRGNIRVNFNYLKADFNDKNHEFQLTPSWNLNITSTHLLSFISSLYFIAREDHQLNGFLGIRYRYTFGPGVEKDSPLKLFGGHRLGYQPLEGNLFLDQNYNTFFDEGDEPLAGVPVLLGDQRVVTDEKGHYLFPRVKTGTYDLAVDEKSVTGPSGKNLDIPLAQKITTYANQGMVVPIAVSVKKASIVVKLFLDNNDNGYLDKGDSIMNLPRVLLKDKQTGETRKIKAYHGEAIIRGIEPGEVIVTLDTADIPEDVELKSSLEDLRSIGSESDSYETVFFFTPIRSLRGKIIVAGNEKLPKNLEVSVGDMTSKVDSEGYYWVKGLLSGKHFLKIRNLPNHLCTDGTLPESLMVPSEPFLVNIDVKLKECH